MIEVFIGLTGNDNYSVSKSYITVLGNLGAIKGGPRGYKLVQMNPLHSKKIAVYMRKNIMNFEYKKN